MINTIYTIIELSVVNWGYKTQHCFLEAPPCNMGIEHHGTFSCSKFDHLLIKLGFVSHLVMSVVFQFGDTKRKGKNSMVAWWLAVVGPCGLPKGKIIEYQSG